MLFSRPVDDRLSLDELCQLTRIGVERLRALLLDSVFEPEPNGTYAWQDAAFIAATITSTPLQIARALLRLGESRRVPRLNRAQPVSVQVPLYQLKYLSLVRNREVTKGGAPFDLNDALEYVLSRALHADLDELPRDIRTASDWLTEGVI